MKYGLFLRVIILLTISCKNASITFKNSSISYPPPDIDTLSKYTYLIKGYLKSKYQGFGSGFFMIMKDKLLFMSTFHNFTTWSTIKKERIVNMDLLNVKLKNKKTQQDEEYPIDIRLIVDTTPHHYYWEMSDIYAYEMPDSLLNKYDIHLISPFFYEYFKNRTTPDKIVLFPYSDTVKPIRVDGNMIGDIYTSWHIGNTISDSLNYKMVCNSSFVGGSGCPVFFLYKKENGNDIERISYGGVNFFKNYDTCTIARPETVRYLKQF